MSHASLQRLNIAPSSSESTLEIPLRELADHALNRLRTLSNVTGLPFAIAARDSGTLKHSPLADLCPRLPEDVLRRFRAGRGARVLEHDETDLVYYAADLSEQPDGQFAVGFLLRDAARPPQSLFVAAQNADWSLRQWSEWVDGLPQASPAVIVRLIELARHELTASVEPPGLHAEIDSLAGELDAVYEELSLLHDVARQLRISLDPVELANLCLHRLHRSLESEGCAALLQDRDGRRHSAVYGDVHLHEDALIELLAHFDRHDWSRPLVENHIAASELAHRFPGVENFIAASILDGEQPLGWILAVNSRTGTEFGTVEANLLSSIALILGTHVRNTFLFLEQEDLLVSFVRSLVSSLDAKDSYTRGHSERVALVAARIARELKLPARDEEEIQLSALLHDIGKIGVSDAVLRKPGRLTDAEFRELQRHPAIGADILSGIKNLQHIIPGVRHHHESWDGSGYPDGLSADEIPLMARILAVADAYDAMLSDRPYRAGLPLDHVENILSEGSGQQWDADLVRAYFSARDDILRIWSDAGTEPIARPAG